MTGYWFIGVAEAAMHAVIDDLKCRGAINFNCDQIAHGLCKVCWTTITVWVLR